MTSTTASTASTTTPAEIAAAVAAVAALTAPLAFPQTRAEARRFASIPGFRDAWNRLDALHAEHGYPWCGEV